jgi:ubiquinone/menaquinone biosynthesis C-methylase UbiE
MEPWYYDEFKHCGVDYAKTAQAERYDEHHQSFRNYAKEFAGMMAFMAIERPGEKTAIDLGCGTGATVQYAAEVFKTVYAVDVSEAMLAKAREKTARFAERIRYVHAGFLTYRHTEAPVDLVMTKAAFHHLPDFWKQVALQRINRMLSLHGQLYIHDVVFQFPPGEFAARIDAWIDRLASVAGDAFRGEIETHIRDEYSTFGWILEGMLDRAGFVVEKRASSDGFVTEYACRKVAEISMEDAR